MLSFGVGWLLVRCWVSGMTHVVVPVYRLLRAAGRLLLWWFVCGVWVLCENWIVDASNLFFLYFVWFILAPSRMRCFVCVVG